MHFKIIDIIIVPLSKIKEDIVLTKTLVNIKALCWGYIDLHTSIRLLVLVKISQLWGGIGVPGQV